MDSIESKFHFGLKHEDLVLLEHARLTRKKERCYMERKHQTNHLYLMVESKLKFK